MKRFEGNLAAVEYFKKKSNLPISQETLFRWHEGEGALKRLIPPWENVSLVQRDPSLEAGSKVHLKNKIGPLSLSWIAKHTKYDPPNLFEDIQEIGPFKYWKHTHLFETIDKDTSSLTDSIEYQPPLFARPFNKIIRSKIEQMFRFRHQRLLNDLLVLQNTKMDSNHAVYCIGKSSEITKRLTHFSLNSDSPILNTNTITKITDDNTAPIDKVSLVLDLYSQTYTNDTYSNAVDKLLSSTRNLLREVELKLFVLAPVQASSENILLKKTLSRHIQENHIHFIYIPMIPYFSGSKIPLSAYQTLDSLRSQHVDWIAMDDITYNLFDIIHSEDIPNSLVIKANQPISMKEFDQTLALHTRVLKKKRFYKVQENESMILKYQFCQSLLDARLLEKSS